MCGKANGSHLVWERCADTEQVPLPTRLCFKVLFYEMLYDLGLIDEVPPWYSPAKQRPVYESDDV